MDLNSILIVVGIVVLLGVAGGCVFAALKLRQALGMLDTKVEPKLDEVGAKLSALKPAVAQTGELMQRVNVTLDALDVEIVKADAKLDQLAALTGKVSDVAQTAPEVARGVGSTLKESLLPKR